MEKRAAIFDMDGLMFDTERLSFEKWHEVSEIMHFPLSRKQQLTFVGTNKEYKRELFRNWYGDTVDYDRAFDLKQELVEEQIKKEGIKVKKGLIDLLQALQSKNISIAVATGTGRAKASKWWDSAGVTPYLAASICGDEIVNSKPDPEIFLKAAEKLDIPITNCMIFEDSFQGIRAAHASGATVFMIPDLEQPTEEIRGLCNYVVKDLGECIPYI